MPEQIETDNRQKRPPGTGMDGLGLFEELTSSSHIKDQEIKSSFWSLFSPNRILAFLPDNEIEKSKLDFMIMEIDYIESKASDEYQSDMALKLENAETESLNVALRGKQGFTFKGVVKMMKVTSDVPVERPDANNAGFLSGIKKKVGLG